MSRFTGKGRSPRETMATNEEDSGDGDIGLKEKVAQLENTLRIFRAEVDMKMKIIEQILNTRNEQFVHQKRILDREQSVYDSVMEHWKNTSELAASGLSLHFSPQREDEFEDTVNYKEFHDQGTNNFHSGSGRSAKSKRKRVKSKPKSMKKDETDEEMEVQVTNDNDSDKEYIPEGEMEKKVFVNYYTDDPNQLEQKSDDPVWTYFLREANGESSLCKLCDDDGVQKIIKLDDEFTIPLARHLKIKHKVEMESGELPLYTKSKTYKPRKSIPKTLATGDIVDYRPKTSPVWNFFTKYKDEEDGCQKSRCNICYKEGTHVAYKMYDGSTSRLRKHLEADHSIDLNALKAAAALNTTADSESTEAQSSKPKKPKLEEDDPEYDPKQSSNTKSETESPQKSKSEKSLVWNYFNKVNYEETHQARCLICKEKGVETIKKTYKGSTSHLSRHLKFVHNIDVTKSDNVDVGSFLQFQNDGESNNDGDEKDSDSTLEDLE